MSEPLPKPRSSLSTVTGTTNNVCNPTAAPWTTARCHRLLRPLASKLQALKSVIQSNPSATSAGVVRPKPKRDPDALFVDVVEKAAVGRGVRPGARVRSKPRRTYSSTGGSAATTAMTTATRTVTAATATATTSSSAGVNDSYLSIWGNVSSASTTDNDPYPLPKRPNRSNPPDPNNPLTILHSLKPIFHPSIFSVCLGIYTCLESVLLSTNSPLSPTSPILPLRILAARKIAHCIIATTNEVDSDDIWYDAMAELGSGGEYLRELVRWHAIELVREATTEGFMGRPGGGLGIIGVLIGLCRTVGAEQEAQSLLQTLFDLHPVISSPNNPALITLKTFFSSTPDTQYRFLTRNFPSTCSNPSWLGSPDIHNFLLFASTEIDFNPGIEALASRALEATFGLWGDTHILALATQRRQAAKRKGPQRGIKSNEGGPIRRKPPPPMPRNIGMKAETIVLKMIESLVLLSLRDETSKARGVLQGLVRGFLAQTPEIRSDTEDVWGERWPVAGKVTVLLQGLGSEDDSCIVEELVKCLEDVRGTGGQEGMKSLASFVAECYLPLYNKYSTRDEVQLLTSRLLTLAAQLDRLEAATQLPPETPRMPGRKVVTFTPGKPALAPDQELREAKRYLVSQLALQIAVSFSLADEVKRDATWIKWLGRFEHKVIGLKIQTPGQIKAVLENPEKREEKVKKKEKKRKGWRYEEGLDLWVAVGATPGRERKRKSGVFMACVEVEADDGDWRGEYEVLDSENATVSEAETESNEYDRPVTPASSSTSDDDGDDDGDDEFYSNICTTPPRTLRRSPRNTARIRKSLASFAVNMSSPAFTMKTPARESATSRRLFAVSVGTGSSLRGSSPVRTWWSDSRGDSSPVLRRGRGMDEGEKYVEGVTEGGISALGLRSANHAFPRLKSQPSSSGPQRKCGAPSLHDLMDMSEDDDPGNIDPNHAICEEATGDDLFTRAINTKLPSSSPPPPTPPPLPRRPKRTSLGAKSTFTASPSRTPTPPRKTSTSKPHRKITCSSRGTSVSTPHGKIVDDPRQQRKIDKSARRRRNARDRRRLRMRLEVFDGSEDELGM